MLISLWLCLIIVCYSEYLALSKSQIPYMDFTKLAPDQYGNNKVSSILHYPTEGILKHAEDDSSKRALNMRRSHIHRLLLEPHLPVKSPTPEELQKRLKRCLAYIESAAKLRNSSIQSRNLVRSIDLILQSISHYLSPHGKHSDDEYPELLKSMKDEHYKGAQLNKSPLDHSKHLRDSLDNVDCSSDILFDDSESLAVENTFQYTQVVEKVGIVQNEKELGVRHPEWKTVPNTLTSTVRNEFIQQLELHNNALLQENKIPRKKIEVPRVEYTEPSVLPKVALPENPLLASANVSNIINVEVNRKSLNIAPAITDAILKPNITNEVLNESSVNDLFVVRKLIGVGAGKIQNLHKPVELFNTDVVDGIQSNQGNTLGHNSFEIDSKNSQQIMDEYITRTSTKGNKLRHDVNSLMNDAEGVHYITPKRPQCADDIQIGTRSISTDVIEYHHPLLPQQPKQIKTQCIGAGGNAETNINLQIGAGYSSSQNAYENIPNIMDIPSKYGNVGRLDFDFEANDKSTVRKSVLHPTYKLPEEAPLKIYGNVQQQNPLMDCRNGNFSGVRPRIISATPRQITTGKGNAHHSVSDARAVTIGDLVENEFAPRIMVPSLNIITPNLQHTPLTGRHARVLKPAKVNDFMGEDVVSNSRHTSPNISRSPAPQPPPQTEKRSRPSSAVQSGLNQGAVGIADGNDISPQVMIAVHTTIPQRPKTAGNYASFARLINSAKK